MKTKHTPGPWTTIRHATPDYAPQYGVYSTNPNSPASDLAIVKGDKAEADAALIGAAPELLEALRYYVAHHQKHSHSMPETNENEGKQWKRELELAQAALARATGEAEP